MEPDSHEPQPPAPASPWALPATTSRHDGWTGERMAAFCETLADTGLVVDACLAAGKSTNTAYALRRHNPLFAAAWEAALTMARERLADTLLARSIEGTVEQYYKEGELVGERRVIDGRLGLAILRRLDRLAEAETQASVRPERSLSRPETSGRSALAPRRQPVDWDLALAALKSADDDLVAEALAMIAGGKGSETHEAHDPPNSPAPDEDDAIDLSDRLWLEDEDDPALRRWMTDFPPPPGFTGYENRRYDEGQHIEAYERECTEEESAILDADAACDIAIARAEEETLRDAWFDMLRSGLSAEPANASPDAAGAASAAPAAAGPADMRQS